MTTEDAFRYGRHDLRHGGTVFVMAGLGPAIHDFSRRNTKSWMPAPFLPGQSWAGMTTESGRA
jgi:hypothetical protein